MFTAISFGTRSGISIRIYPERARGDSQARTDDETSHGRGAGDVTWKDLVAINCATRTPGAWLVRTLSGDEITAAAVIVAAGTPAAARRLIPVDPGWGDLGAEVTAACLDLGVRHTRARFVLGIDEPVYLSPHAPPGQLAPEGRGLVHVMRYGSRATDADRAQLRALAEAAGISAADVAVQRFLPRMVVATSLPAPGVGLAGRPPARVPGAPGVFVAGDWVGPEGWLSDCSLASGERAGIRAALAALAPGAPGHARARGAPVG